MTRQGKLPGLIKKRIIKIAPSVLAADFSCLGSQVGEAAAAGADYIHCDVMDGHFVPNISIGVPVIASLRKATNVPLDVHLMIEQPELYIDKFAEAGAAVITIHAEACTHLDGALNSIRKLGLKAGVSLNPATPLAVLDEVLPLVDMVLIMTVNPGFGGQVFISSMLDKIARMRQIMEQRKSGAELEVDGGITKETAPLVVKAGANVLVAGSAVFSAAKSIRAAMEELRGALC